MKALLLHLDGTEETVRHALGAVAIAIVRTSGGKRLFNKGHVITQDDLPALREAGQIEIPLLVPEEGDVHENEAAMRLGHALAGEGVEVLGPSEARSKLVAAHKGLLRVDASTVQEIDCIDSMSIFTLFDGQPVEAMTTVAEAKVTPLLASREDIERAEALASVEPRPVRVLPFRPVKAAALIRERVGPEQARRVVQGLTNKLNWFGSGLAETAYLDLGASPETAGNRMRDLLQGGADMLLVTGGSTSNPFDPLLNGLKYVPAKVERLGVPVHPGSMLWVAYTDDSRRIPIVGVPSCGMFSEATAFDLVLPLVLAGESLTSTALAALGHGGLLRGGDLRFPGYGK